MHNREERRYNVARRISMTWLRLAPALLLCAIGLPQTTAPPVLESIQELASGLTPEQKQQFDTANQAFNSRRYADALPIYKQLLQLLPGEAVVSKLAAEAALNTGDNAYSMITLRPVASANPNDWQAAALLTRACAQAGDKACRDESMAHMLDLHARGITPGNMNRYIAERLAVGENSMLLFVSLEPWGAYKVYDLGQVFDNNGKIFLRITIESGDADQPLFAKEHPVEAASGMRRFSLDAYRETGLNNSGQRTQTHYTYGFFQGQPPYETVRTEFIAVAMGKRQAISSRSNLVVP